MTTEAHNSSMKSALKGGLLRIKGTLNEAPLVINPRFGFYEIPVTEAYTGPVEVDFIGFDGAVYRSIRFNDNPKFELKVGDSFKFVLTKGGKPVSWNQ